MTPTPKNIAIIGSTGSIGTQTIQVIKAFPEHYRVSVLAAGQRVNDLIDQARLLKPKLAIIANRQLYQQLHDALAPLGIETAAGAQALAEAVTRPDVDMVVTATVGFSGLIPTVNAIRAGKDIALANKETLVVAGEIINTLLNASSSRIYPVDSEHSAIAQCLVGEHPGSVRRLLITASGGPFLNWSTDKIACATAAQALKHPNWNMGAKITIDSATMLNKAFEIIEAHYLFNIEPRRIKALVHPQSIVHSMVEFKDSAVKAQLGTPSMTLPIAYALGCATRMDRVTPRLDLCQLSTLTFAEPDTERFPCLTMAHYALEHRGNVPCIINAANEVAVDAFLHGKITFGQIYPLITKALENIAHIRQPDLSTLMQTDTETRNYTLRACSTINVRRRVAYGDTDLALPTQEHSELCD